MAVLSVCLACMASVVFSGAPPAGEPSVPYRACLKGLRYGEMKDAVRAQSLTMSLAQYPPATERQLVKRAEEDIPVMTAALKAFGYLDAIVAMEVATNRCPTRVTFRARKGPRYTIRSFRVIYPRLADGVPPVPKRLGLKASAPAAVEAVEGAEAAALRFLQENGYPHPQKLERVVARDEKGKTVEVVCTLDPGPRATLGPTDIEGLDRLEAGYVQRRIQWTAGDPYNIQRLDDLEKDLLNSGLFLSVRVAATNALDDSGALPVQIRLSERSHRTVRTGASYYTDEGFGGQASWENRNWLGAAEALSFALYVSEIKYGARSGFTRPDFFSRDTDLHVDLDAFSEQPDAYESDEARLAVLLEKRMEKELILTGGIAYEYSQVKQQEDDDLYGLVSVPLSVEWDLRDDKLDPSRGGAVLFSTAPYQDVLSDISFLKSQGDGSVFLRLFRSPRTVLALRATIGTITGEPVDGVPADKRFYAGGGGTVRGYKYQSIGELVDGEPVGGNSMATVSSELRIGLTRTLGAALFLDGGTAYPESQPDLDTPFLWGAGCGLRYYLGSAPLRMDVAFPLQPREDVDAAFQVYISLGQSF